jgi:hypothetical protein
MELVCENSGNWMKGLYRLNAAQATDGITRLIMFPPRGLNAQQRI